MAVRVERLYLACLISLVYHEARAVRRLRPADRQPGSVDWGRLLTLSNHSDVAWKQMSKLRSRAEQAKTAELSAQVFRQEFGPDMAELCELFQHRGWDGLGWGGVR